MIRFSTRLYLAWLCFFAVSVSAYAAPIFASEENVGMGKPRVERGMIDLKGEWEFHWMQLLEPTDWRRGSVPIASYFPVPSTWRHEVSGDSEGIGQYGYGTYRLLLHVPESDVGRTRALFLRSINSAYRLWIDGKEKPGLGTVGTSREQERPQSHLHLVFFQPERETVELVIQVSNYSFREGGIGGEVLYGNTAVLIPYILKGLLYDIFVIGGFLMIGLYHFIVYAIRRRDPSTLWVGLLATAVALRTLFINGYLSTTLLHLESWELLVKLEYTSELVGFMAVIYLMKSLYPAEVSRRMVVLSLFLSIGLFLFVLLTPARVYTESMLLQTVLKAVILLYFVFYVGVAAFLRKREGAWIQLLSLLIIIGAALNDALYFLHAAHTVELLDYSIVLFILAQAIVVSYRYSRLSHRNEVLREELEGLNANLEQRVESRTNQLQEANRHLSQMKEIRSKMLTNIAHDLGSPMTGIQMYLQLMAEHKLTIDHTETAKHLLDSSKYVQRLVRDIFELSKLESGESEFHYELTAVEPWLRSVHEQMAQELQIKGFSLQLSRLEGLGDDGASVYVRIDRMRMMQTLWNYIDNAVKFSEGRSDRITLNSYVLPVRGERSEKSELVVEVVDSGVGMVQEELEKAFQRLYTKRKYNEVGSGLGLAIVKEIVTRHGGQVGASSEPGEGSVFYFQLPVVHVPD
jgi:signal transduction histidine kinase